MAVTADDMLTCVQSLQAAAKSCVTIAMRSSELLLIAQASLAFAWRQREWAEVMFTATAIFISISTHIIVLGCKCSYAQDSTKSERKTKMTIIIAVSDAFSVRS